MLNQVSTAITVLDRAGTHTAVYVPPPSRQPRAVVKASRFDRSAIMTAAWADYRTAVRRGWTGKGFDRARWAYCLNWAWTLAKVAVAKVDADRAAEIRLAQILIAVRSEVEPKFADPVKQARAEAIRGELLALEYSDAVSPDIGDRELTLKAELARLAA